MTFFWPRSAGVILVTACIGLAGCSSTSNDSSVPPEPTSVAPTDEERTETADSTISEDSATGSEPSDDSQPEDSTGSSSDDDSTTPEPLRPNGEPQPTTPPDPNRTSAYISRVSMNANSIEVGWSEREGAAEYHIHRAIRTSDDEPPAAAMTADNLIHTTEDLVRFVDDDVDEGTEYWHGVRVLTANGELMAHGWHKTAAVDDEEPPSIVDGITALVEDGEVLITWTTPDENYELHSYRVLRAIDGEPAEQIGQTWRLDQMSFIDDDPPSGEVVYQIRALDFHWNLSEPGSITVEFP